MLPLHAFPPREDDDDNDVIFGLDGASSSFTFVALCATESPLAVPVLSLGEGAGLLTMSSSSSSSEGSTASSLTLTLLLTDKLVLLLLEVAAAAVDVAVLEDLLLFMLYILWTIRMCLFNMS